eukprot:4220738-Amphidinium_carterae.1
MDRWQRVQRPPAYQQRAWSWKSKPARKGKAKADTKIIFSVPVFKTMCNKMSVALKIQWKMRQCGWTALKHCRNPFSGNQGGLDRKLHGSV